jgi:pantetheine-phosphate adenylyltransferase
MNQSIYAASLDPITLAHKNIVERALRVFDKILVSIGVNETKKPLFTLNERVNMAKKELSEFGDKVEVRSFTGMLSDFAYENNIKTVIRGARSAPDFDSEKLLSDINRYNGVDTIIYTTIPEMSHISSSAAKAITLNAGKNTDDFVSLDVKRKLEEKLLYQYRIGITGGIGTGKSYISKKLCEFCQSALDTYIIDFDEIGHYILEKGIEPIYKTTREVVCALLQIDYDGGPVDIKQLRDKIFKGSKPGSLTDLLRNKFNEVMYEPSMYEIRKRFLEYKGAENHRSLVIITGALLCEMENLHLFNNNLILVNADENTVVKRLNAIRGYSMEQIRDRREAQPCYDLNKLNAEQFIKTDKSGHLWEIDNNEGHSGWDFMSIVNNLRI